MDTVDQYEKQNEKVYPDGSVIRSYSPILSPEESTRRQKQLYLAAYRFLQHVELCKNREGEHESMEKAVLQG